MFDFIIQMIIKYSSPRILHKIVKQENVIKIAKMWISGHEYYIIQLVAELCDYRIFKRNNEATISVEDIASICDGDFGYTASLIINSICEIIKLNGSVGDGEEEDTLLKCVETLQRISQKLKYGLPEQTDIFVYELGFNDRFLAQEIRRIIGNKLKKKEVIEAIKQNHVSIEILLNDYPSVFQNRLNNL